MELYLVRTDSGVDDEWIRFPLKPNEPLGLGRSQENHVRLLSFHVSRHHASIKKTTDGQFMIKDENSMNGVLINDTRVKLGVWNGLKESDKVEIGRPFESDAANALDMKDRFIYVVKSAASVDLDRKKPGPRSHFALSCRKMVKSSNPKNTLGGTGISKIEQVGTKRPLVENATVERSEKGTYPLETNNNNSEKQLEIEQEMERENKRLKLELEKKELALKEELDARNKKLEEQQRKIASEMEENFKIQLEEKEEELEMRLQLEKDIAIEQCKANIEKEEKPSSSLLTVVNTMENELQCSICAELFIVSTTLNCAHTFCEFCISQWRKVKSICPVCRHPIETMTRSLVLDNYIDKVLESLSSDRIEFRKKLIDERKKLIEEENRKSRSSRRGRGRSRGRGRGRNSGVRYYERRRPTPRVHTRSSILVISDDDSDSSLEDQHSEIEYLGSLVGSQVSTDDSDEDSENDHYYY